MKRALSFAENLPSLVFLLLWRLEADLALTGWLASVLALAVLVALRVKRQRPDSILLGVNLHFALAAPVIHGAFLFGPEGLGAVLLAYSGVAVLGMVVCAGLGLQLFTAQGFAPRGWALLALAAGGCIWSYAFMGQQFLSVGLPLLALFLARRGLNGVTLAALLLPRRPQDALFV